MGAADKRLTIRWRPDGHGFTAEILLFGEPVAVGRARIRPMPNNEGWAYTVDNGERDVYRTLSSTKRQACMSIRRAAADLLLADALANPPTVPISTRPPPVVPIDRLFRL